MRTYDTLITGFITWIMIILGYYILPDLFPQILIRNQVFILIGFLLCFISILLLIIHYLIIKKERNIINKSLLKLKNEGITLFMKKYEKLLYSRDIADIPVIAHLFINFNCLAISQPKNIEELKKIIRFCEHFRIQLIPRGAGTSGYGGAIAMKNGVVVDLTRLNQIIFLDKDKQIVEVESGVTWENLRMYLKSHGFDLICYPSSAPSSTIGGWLNQGGYGIGSSKFGSVVESVESIIILATNGKEFRYDDPGFLMGSCGTLGVTWKIQLKLQPVNKLFHFSLASESQDFLLDALNEFQKLSPYFLRYIDNQNVVWKQLTKKINWNSHEYKGGIISISFQEKDLHSYKMSLLHICGKNDIILCE
jgi:FAD/FMN-containing dehydrogenase